jgi:hypothetical protein
MFAEGWEVAVADLRRVCSIQPVIFTDHAEERAQELHPGNLSALAALSLPLPVATHSLPAQFDHVKNAWMLSSANPNLRVLGNWGGEVQPGIIGFGFAVQVSPSFMQIASFRGRLLLRDGYHRAYGLLRRGITEVPVFTKSFSTVESLELNPGMLPQDAYLGERPATLQDYLDDRVAVDVQLPGAQKMIVIQALELTPLS